MSKSDVTFLFRNYCEQNDYNELESEYKIDTMTLMYNCWIIVCTIIVNIIWTLVIVLSIVILLLFSESLQLMFFVNIIGKTLFIFEYTILSIFESIWSLLSIDWKYDFYFIGCQQVPWY